MFCGPKHVHSLCPMPKPVSGRLSRRKRQGPEDCVGQRPSKRPKINRRPPTFWDNLSRIWLTRDALEELDRRNSASISSEPPRSRQRPVTRLQEKERRPHQKLPSGTIYSGPATLNDIRRYSRGGGPDLSDLRNVCYLHYCELLVRMLMCSLVSEP